MLHACRVDLAWDLSLVLLPPSGSLEPSSGSVVTWEAFATTGAASSCASRGGISILVDLVSRAAAQGGQGRERDRAEVGMSISDDGDRVLHVRRLRWKFRGTEKVDLGGGDRVLVSWGRTRPPGEEGEGWWGPHGQNRHFTVQLTVDGWKKQQRVM